MVEIYHGFFLKNSYFNTQCTTLSNYVEILLTLIQNLGNTISIFPTLKCCRNGNADPKIHLGRQIVNILTALAGLRRHLRADLSIRISRATVTF